MWAIANKETAVVYDFHLIVCGSWILFPNGDCDYNLFCNPSNLRN